MQATCPATGWLRLAPPIPGPLTPLKSGFLSPPGACPSPREPRCRLSLFPERFLTRRSPRTVSHPTFRGLFPSFLFLTVLVFPSAVFPMLAHHPPSQPFPFKHTHGTQCISRSRPSPNMPQPVPSGLGGRSFSLGLSGTWWDALGSAGQRPASGCGARLRSPRCVSRAPSRSPPTPRREPFSRGRCTLSFHCLVMTLRLGPGALWRTGHRTTICHCP